MKQINIVLNVDEDIIINESDQANLNDAILQELGWLHDSGMFVESWSFVDPEKNSEKDDKVQELSVKTKLGEIAVRVKTDVSYPGVYVDLRGPGLNDKFEKDTVGLAMVEFEPDKHKIQTVVYGNGNAEDYTHLIEHVNVLEQEMVKPSSVIQSASSQNDYSKYSTEDLVKMEQSAYADYYKLATRPQTNPSKEDLEPLEKATALWAAIGEELRTRKQSLNDQIQSASTRAAGTHSSDKLPAIESTLNR